VTTPVALPYFTKAVLGCGGTFKSSVADFEVEEVPAYLPSGEGEHLFLWIEKRDRSTQDVARELAAQLGVQESAISWAGLKDRNAVTRQFLCLPARLAGSKLASVALTGATVLSSARHRNKLKSGHLHGNQFRVVLRGIVDAGAAESSLTLLRSAGLPNYYGAQRFGMKHDNAERGKAILLRGGRHRDRFERKLFLSAFQSELFNRVLARRIEASTMTAALAGDVLKKHESGGEFVCDDPETDQRRADLFELSATGPMFGPDMRATSGVPEEIERQVLAEAGVTLQTFEAGGGETAGARRHLRVPLKNLSHRFLEENTAAGARQDLEMRFELPAGAYATTLIRELLKTDAAPAAGIDNPLAAVGEGGVCDGG
jgi:tRNA pseudouridine13 synthase